MQPDRGWAPPPPPQPQRSALADPDVGHLINTLASGLHLGTPRINTFSGKAIPGKTEVSFKQWYQEVHSSSIAGRVTTASQGRGGTQASKGAQGNAQSTKDPSTLQCFRCQGWGHMARECATPAKLLNRDGGN